MEIKKDSMILFTGDSITDCGRDRNDYNSLSAYSKIISDYINIFNPELNLKVTNRAISGFTTKMLDDVMEQDLTDTKPDVVSLLVGINDVWRKYDSNNATTIEQFINNYKSIITKTKKYTSNIMILEPFLIPSDINKEVFRDDLDPKIDALRKLTKEEKLQYIPLDGIFAEKSISENPKNFSADGVHPVYGGYKIIANEWIKRTNLFKAGL